MSRRCIVITILLVLLSSFCLATDPCLVAHWDVNETEGSIVHDSVGDNDGLLYDDANWSTVGKLDGCVKLDGIGDYIQCNSDDASPIIPEGSEYTISAWIRPANTSNTRAFYGYYSSSDVNYLAYSMKIENGKFYTGIGNGTNIEWFNTNGTIYSDRWYHLATVFDGNSLYGYVDGKLIGESEVTLTGVFPKAGTGTKRELIGGGYGGLYGGFYGSIDEVKVWTRPLSEEDIEEEYDNGFVKNGTVYVSDYGAYPDDANDDAACIQSAIDDPCNEQKEILFDSGTYLISDALYLNRFTHLTGQNTTLKNLDMDAQSPGSEVMIKLHNKCLLKDLIIDGDDKCVIAARTAIAGTEEVRIENCTFENYKGNSYSNEVVIRIYDNGKDITFESCTFRNISDDTSCRALSVGVVENMDVNNCVFRNIFTDINADADFIHVLTSNPNPFSDPNIPEENYWEPSDVDITNSGFYDSTYRAIKLQCSGCTVSNNLMATSKCSCAIGTFGEDTIIEKNRIFIGDEGCGIGVSQASSISQMISDNIIVVPGDGFPENGFGVVLYKGPTNIQIYNNNIRGCTGLDVCCIPNPDPNISYKLIENVLDVSKAIRPNNNNPNNVVIGNVLPWSDQNTYDINALVLYGDSIYESLDSNNIGNEPTDPCYWDFNEAVDFNVPKVHNVNTHKWYYTIQDAIESANNDDEIVVYPGTYYESVSFGGKTIVLRGSDPNDWDVVEKTVIRGSGDSNAVSLSCGDDIDILGFSVSTDGEDEGIYGLGYGCQEMSVSLRNCIIEENTRGFLIQGCDLDIDNCIVRDNTSEGINLNDGTHNIKNSLICGNDDGIVLYGGDNTIVNCTIVNNDDYGICAPGACTHYISNCILWGNGDDLMSNCDATYSCVEDGDAGEGNISSDPCFIADDAYYHLQLNSPCIEGGDPNGSYDGQVDIDGDDRVIDANVDMGADESSAISWWKFEEGEGATAYDSAGDNDGTLNGNPQWVSGNVGSWALDFDGDGDYVDCGNPSEFNFGDGNFSISFWLKTNKDTGEFPIWKNGYNSASGYCFYKSSAGIIGFELGDGTHRSYVYSTTSVEDDEWHHVVGMTDGTNVSIWVDGEPEGESADITENCDTSTHFYIGKYTYSSYDFSGTIDDVRVYDRALAEDEVETLYLMGN